MKQKELEVVEPGEKMRTAGRREEEEVSAEPEAEISLLERLGVN